MKELTLRELQLMLLEIVKDVHHFCVENNIKYSLTDGSILGAIRHKGFIPWDDDVDIIMPRPDYERFCQTYQSDSCRVKYRGNDPNCQIAFARVFDTKKTVMQTSIPWCKEECGVWIDIFPADGALDNVEEHALYYVKNRNYWGKTCSLRNLNLNYLKEESLIVNIKRYIFAAIRMFGLTDCLIDYYIRKMIQRGKAVPFGSTNYWTQIMCMGDNSKEHNRMETLAECSLMPFEDTEVYVMNGYEEFLRGKYNDYMQLPPVEQRVGHGNSYIHFYWK